MVDLPMIKNKNPIAIIALLIFLAFKINFVVAADHDCEKCRATIRTSIHGSTGKWLNQDVPHRNWQCIEVEDLGSPSQTCEMCEQEEIRYIYKMVHDDHESLEVGCICAGHMDGNFQTAKARDDILKSRTQRRANWLNLSWKISHKGNPYLKTRKNNQDNINHIVTITKSKHGQFSASIDSNFLNTWYQTMDEAKLAAFDHIWPKTITKW